MGSILNYTTSISSEKTYSEIQGMLARAGASAVMSEFEQGILESISFRLNTSFGFINFRLPANTEGVYQRLINGNMAKKYKTRDQASRVAWRIVKVWIGAQLAMVEAEMADMVEVFLPYAKRQDGQTQYESMVNNNFECIALGNS